MKWFHNGPQSGFSIRHFIFLSLPAICWLQHFGPPSSFVLPAFGGTKELDQLFRLPQNPLVPLPWQPRHLIYRTGAPPPQLEVVQMGADPKTSLSLKDDFCSKSHSCIPAASHADRNKIQSVGIKTAKFQFSPHVIYVSVLDRYRVKGYWLIHNWFPFRGPFWGFGSLFYVLDPLFLS